MKRNLLFYLLFTAVAVSLSAQADKNKFYWIYSVAGDVSMEGNRLRKKDEIKENQIVFISENSHFTVLDEQRQRLYCFNTPGERSLKEMIADTEVSVVQLTGNYLKYIKDQLFPKKQDEKSLSKIKTGARRGGEEDILFVNSLCSKLNLTANITVQEALSKSSLPESNYNVSFQIVSLVNRTPLLRANQLQNPYVLYVKNHENKLLFVNVLYIDREKGEYKLVLQPDREDEVMNYLLPPKSTILFSETPFVLTNIKNDAFILIATDFPVDFSVLEEPIKKEEEEESSFNIGFSKIEIQ